jgi:RNA polymerase sigma-70 factor (ECF subfamily)
VQGFSDEQLIALSNDARQSDARRRQAIDELVGRYQTRVALWCYRVVRQQDWAADLAQEVFLRALRGLSGFRGASKFSTWLYTIARNHCLNAVQSKAIRAEEPLEFLQLPDPGRPIDRAIEQEQHLDQLRRIFDETLDETERQIMTLHYGEDLTLDSITRLLGLTNASGAKAYIVSARRKLRTASDRRRTGKP